MAISAAHAYGASKEDALTAYCEAVIARGLDPNDEHHGTSAVVQASYCGYCKVVEALLLAGCSADGRGPHGHAVMAAVRNGQHHTLALLLRHPSARALKVL